MAQDYDEPFVGQGTLFEGHERVLLVRDDGTVFGDDAAPEEATL